MSEKDKRNQDPAERLSDLLGHMPSIEKSKDFDQRFRQKLEVAKQAGAPSFLQTHRVAITCAIFALVCALGLGSVSLVKDQPAVTLLQGEIPLTNTTGTQPLSVERQLSVGDRIETGPSDWAIVELENKYRIKLNPNSQLQIQQLKSRWFPGQTTLNLSKGTLLVSIRGGKNHRYPMEVQSSNVYAKAKGTQFAVRAPIGANPQAWIAVMSGKVEVGTLLNQTHVREALALVQKGQEVFVTDKAEITTPQTMAQNTQAMLREQFQFGQPNQAILLIGWNEKRIYELLEPCAIYIHVDSSRKDMQTLKRIVNQIGKAADSGNIPGQKQALIRLETLIQSQEDLDRVPLMLFIGAYYQSLKAHADAVRVFEDLVQQNPHSSMQSLALLAAAKIAFENLRDSAKARRLLTVVLTDHKGSLEISEARRLLGQLPPNESQPQI